MNYDLADKLRGMGFPQYGFNTDYDGDTIKTDKGAYIPTLEELIEACGDGFDGLILNRGQLADGETRYSAAGGRVIGLGATPTIAVAKLWLSLQEDKVKP